MRAPFPGHCPSCRHQIADSLVPNLSNFAATLYRAVSVARFHWQVEYYNIAKDVEI